MDYLNVTQRIIPNLTITVDADSSDVIRGLEITETIEDSRNTESENETNSFRKDYVELQQAWRKSLNLPKRYENKDGGFFTGVDMSCDVLLNKLEKRAERFGLEKKEETITRKEIDEVYKSLGIEPEDTNPNKLKNIRLETLHMRGVDNMNTRDVFAYFQDYAPSAVEWINDRSCNVVWFDAVTTARAMIGMSQPFRAKKKSAVNPELSESSDKVIETNISETEVARESSTSKETDDKSTEMDEMSKNPMELDEGSYSGKSDEESETKSSSSVLADVDVPIPPGYWRLGVPHPKAKAILFRFATKGNLI
ncbi:nuclear cap-binding protein subunit 3 [Caerostris extrusa]|uniref:Nuclear cap-binding protein subunit 3 n=1 Tax=Caerostris extrusa TaxID=172846 RepID=A0AAV4MEP5_CAEEX|nr:nuclear cap-binding protein subunit 3 [Caerostris extrusa]